LYGSDRDVGVAKRLNRGVEPSERLVLTVSGSPIVPQDLLRRFSAEPAPADMDGFLITDVYQLAGDLGDEPLSPAFFAQLCAKGPVVWVGHLFNGALGLHADGGWVRTPAGAIRSYPDPRTSSYASHLDPAWIHQDGCECGVAWTVNQTVADLDVVFFNQADLSFQPRTHHVPAYAWTTLPVPVLDNFMLQAAFTRLPAFIRRRPTLWGWFFRQVDAVVDPRLVGRLRDWYSYRTVSQYTLGQLMARATAEFKNSGYATLRDLFPDETETILRNTVLAALTSTDHVTSTQLTALNLALGDTWHDVNLGLRAIGSAPSPTDEPWSKTMLFGGVVASILCVFMMRRRMRSIFSVLLAAPMAMSTVGTATWFLNIGLTVCANMLGTPAHLWVAGAAQLKNIIGQYVPASNPLARNGYIMPEVDSATLVTTVVIAPVVEEVLKHLPIAGLPCTAVISVAEIVTLINGLAFVGATPAVIITSATTHLFKHWAMHKMPLAYAVPLHAAHNLMTYMFHNSLLQATMEAPFWVDAALLTACAAAAAWWYWRQRSVVPPRAGSAWAQFRAMFYDAPWNARPPTEPLDVVTSEPLVLADAVVAKEYIPHAEVPEQADPSEVQVIMPVGFSPDSSGRALKKTQAAVHYGMPTNAPGYSPGQSDQNAHAIVQCRLAKLPPTPECDTVDGWASALEIMLPGVIQALGRSALRTFLSERVIDSKTLQKGLAHVRTGCLAIASEAMALELCAPVSKISTQTLDDHWVAHFDTSFARKRAARAILRKLESPLDSTARQMRSTKIDLKKNELLFQRASDGSQIYAAFKARPIANVAPENQGEVGPETNAASTGLKAVFHPLCRHGTRLQYLTPRDSTYSIYFYYGGACTDFDLSAFMDIFLEDPKERVIYVIVSGDDVAALVRWNGRMTTIEADMSMFDQSHGTAALRSQMLLGFAFGMSIKVSCLLDASHYATYIVPTTQGPIKLRRVRPSRDTGGADTSFGNSLTVGTATVFALIESIAHSKDDASLFDEAVLTATYLELGFKAKLRVHRPLHDASHVPLRTVTFLKGKWWTVEDAPGHYAWAPLPSRVLKFGKCLRDPRELYAGLDRAAAMEAYLAGQSAQYKTFADVPLLRELCRTCQGPLRHATTRDANAAYKVKGSYDYGLDDLVERWLRLDSFNRFSLHGERAMHRAVDMTVNGRWLPELEMTEAYLDISDRYKVPLSLIRSTAIMIRQARPPSFLMSPLFEAMARIDYG
jgi:hypothetical protein